MSTYFFFSLSFLLSLPRTFSLRACASHLTNPKARLFDSATAIFAVEGGALDNVVLSSERLAVVVLGRDPAVPYPEGCAFDKKKEELALDRKEEGGGGGDQEGNSETERGGGGGAGLSFDEPFTHRPLLQGALGGSVCAGFVPALPGARFRVDVKVAVRAFRETMTHPRCALSAVGAREWPNVE